MKPTSLYLFWLVITTPLQAEMSIFADINNEWIDSVQEHPTPNFALLCIFKAEEHIDQIYIFSFMCWNYWYISISPKSEGLNSNWGHFDVPKGHKIPWWKHVFIVKNEQQWLFSSPSRDVYILIHLNFSFYCRLLMKMNQKLFLPQMMTVLILSALSQILTSWQQGKCSD